MNTHSHILTDIYTVSENAVFLLFVYFCKHRLHAVFLALADVSKHGFLVINKQSLSRFPSRIVTCTLNY